MFRPDAKDNIKTVLKYAVATAIATILITFLIVLPLRDVIAPDAEKRTEGVVKQIENRLEKLEKRLQEQIAKAKRQTIAHREHSCTQHAFEFLASLDPGELRAFNKREVRQAFSTCPAKLRYSIVRRGGPSPQQRRGGG